MATRTISIVCHDDDGTFDVFEGEDFRRGLRWADMLGMAAELTHSSMQYAASLSLRSVDEHLAIDPPAPKPRPMWPGDIGGTEDDYIYEEIPF